MAQRIDLLLIKTHHVRFRWLPMGLMYVAQAAENIGAKVRIIDLSLEREYENALCSALRKSQPRLVGIGGMYTEFEETKEIAKMVKEVMPQATTVVGGPLTSALLKECLEDTNIEIASLQEGESTIQDLIRYLDGKMELPEIKGIAYRRNGRLVVSEGRPSENINAVPIPAWHLIDARRYLSSNDNWFGIEHLKMLNIVPTRGCPYACVFCDKNVFGSKWRGRDPKNIVDEMVMLRDNYGAEAIMFLDDIFDVNKKWVLSFIDEMKARNVRMYWGCSSRVNHADYDLYKKMHDAGCCYIFYGIEFGSDAMLKKSGKAVTSAQSDRAITIAKQAGLRVIGAYMLGMLGETEEELQATIKSAINSTAEVATITVLTPIAGTELFNMGLSAGKIEPAWPWWKATRANAYINLTKDVSNRRLAYLASKTYWMLFWTRPSRKFPKWFCKLMQHSFYIFGPFAGDRFINFIFWLDGVRRKLRLGLP
jgi:radical SAM superfamily enzyme YgiQ (UPF0313 family)